PMRLFLYSVLLQLVLEFRDTIYTGRDILLTARAEGASDGTEAVFKISSNRSEQVRTVHGKITDGKAEAVWTVECLEPLSSIKKGETVSYSFTCEAGGKTITKSAPAALSFVCRVYFMGPEDVSDFKDVYELQSTDGSYRKKVRVANSTSQADNPSSRILEFDGVKPGLRYRLDYFNEEGVSPNTVKENVSFAEIME
ncbi:MAG TPA: hypothetical protein PKK43_13320, partial [Spirochaetota bacterium]|nr:hypothetical protein [Spirochaetota bacterium]